MILPTIGFILVMCLGGWVVWTFDHHDPIGFHIQVFGFHPGFDLPDSLATREQKALLAAKQAQSQLVPWQNAYQSEKNALITLQKANQTLINDGKADVAVSQKQIAWDLATLQWADEQRSKVVSSLPTAGGDACQRAEAVQAAFVAQLRNTR